MVAAPNLKFEFAKVKDQHDLASYIEKEVGYHGKELGRLTKFICPFHKEDTASFVVYNDTQTWHCFGCGLSGDIYDFIQQYHFGSIERGRIKRDGNLLDMNDQQVRAYLILTKEVPPPPEKKRSLLRFKPRHEAAIPMQDVERYHYNRRDALPFFAQRGITEQSYDWFMLGAEASYEHVYRFKSSEYSVTFHGRRHTIPWFSGNEVRIVQRRRDDAYAYADLTRRSAEDLLALRKDIVFRSKGRTTYEAPEEVPYSVLIEHCYGPKYYLRPGKRASIYGANLLYQTQEDGTYLMRENRPVVRRWPYLLITEGELNRISAMQLGFPSIAAKVKSGLDYDYALSGVESVFIIGDPDEAGVRNAEKWVETLGRGRIFYPPKDMNDLLVDGALRTWIEASIGVKPIPAIIGRKELR